MQPTAGTRINNYIIYCTSTCAFGSINTCTVHIHNIMYMYVMYMYIILYMYSVLYVFFTCTVLYMIYRTVLIQSKNVTWNFFPQGIVILSDTVYCITFSRVREINWFACIGHAFDLWPQSCWGCWPKFTRWWLPWHNSFSDLFVSTVRGIYLTWSFDLRNMIYSVKIISL